MLIRDTDREYEWMLQGDGSEDFCKLSFSVSYGEREAKKDAVMCIDENVMLLRLYVVVWRLKTWLQ